MEDYNVYGIALVPVILALVELLKRMGIPKKFSPLVALILGILSGFYYIAPGEPQKAIFLGVVTGLSAIGLFSGTKNTIEDFLGNSNPERKGKPNVASKKVKALLKNKDSKRAVKK